MPKPVHFERSLFGLTTISRWPLPQNVLFVIKPMSASAILTSLSLSVAEEDNIYVPLWAIRVITSPHTQCLIILLSLVEQGFYANYVRTPFCRCKIFNCCIISNVGDVTALRYWLRKRIWSGKLHTQQEKMSITEKKSNVFFDLGKGTDMIYSSALILAVLMF